jgi:outer membrane protein OmpA-like peptidoglycan-associated protein
MGARAGGAASEWGDLPMRLKGAWPVAAIVLALLAVAPSRSWAQPFQGIYIGAGAGLDVPERIRITTPQPTSPRQELVLSNGVVGVASVGYGMGNGFRFELEGNFRNNSLAHLIGTSFPTASSGNVRTYGVMANVLFDIDIGFPWLYPYIGGGAGYAWTNMNNISVVAPGGGFALQGNGTKGSFAFQAIGGLSFPVPRVPGLSVTTEYRFLGIPESESFGVTNAGSPQQLKLNRQFSNSFLLGVRYAFGVTPPVSAAAPAQTAPAPAPSRSYQVFFDWDKATLSDRARQIIKEAASGVAAVQTTRIEVNGYTDTSGTPKYNQGLSLRRAQVVAAELVKDGVAKDIIVIQGFGETHLLVPTGPGVREPQNRRVEIILH